MRNLLNTSFLFLAALASPLSTALAYDWFDGVVDWGLGWRRDRLHWSISDCEGDIDPQATIDWREMQIIEAMARLKLTSCDHVYLRTYADGGLVLTGESKFQRFDAQGNRLVSSDHCVRDRWVYDGSAGVGYKFFSCDHAFEAAPLVGYSVHGQKFEMTDGCIIEGLPDILAHLIKFKHVYRTQWQGPWVGFDIAYHLCDRIHIIGEAEYHWSVYNAEGKWERRRFEINDDDDDDQLFYKEFKDKASGWGQIYTVGINYTTVCRPVNWALGLFSSIQDFKTRRGCHRTVKVESLLDPEDVFALPLDKESRLNPIKWFSWKIMLTFDAYF